MGAVSGNYWQEVHQTGLAVPSDRPLDELTAELTRMLGDPDPGLRSEIAAPTLTTWIQRGVYDDLLPGLGDGMATGLAVGLGDVDTDTVFRRSHSVLVLGACIARDNQRPLVPGGKVLEWGDRVATYLLRERDLRGFVPGKGGAHAITHGADALATLAGSPHVAKPELTVVLDVIADRVLARVDRQLGYDAIDRLATATLAVLRRNLVPLSVLEPWVARIAGAAGPPGTATDRDTGLAHAHPQLFLRALYLQLALGPKPPEVRSDLLLVVVEALRRSNATLLRG